MLILLLTLLGQDFETKYHDAYVLEVVEGKPAEAARAYLDLLRAEALPPKLKFQARFRVAVTFALLGRPDEARARLAELAADEETPKSLLPQVAEYRKALESAGVGSDLEKRMEELTYGLGRSIKDPPDEYRDFAIIGAPAIPFLRKLQKHTDAALREHAFRLLCRMDVGGLGGEWEPKWGEALAELGHYLVRHPGEVPAAEAKLMDLPDVGAIRALDAFLLVPLSDGVIERLVARPALREWVIRLKVAQRHYGRWIRDGDPALALQVVQYYDAMLKGDKKGAIAFDPALFPFVWRRLVGVPSGGNSLTGFARRVTAEALVAAMDEMLTLAAEWEEPAEGSPLSNYLIYVVAYALPAGEVDPARFAALLDRWSRLGGGGAAESVLPLYAKVIGALPDAHALEIARSMAGSPVRSQLLLDNLLLASLPRTLAALEATAGQRREQIANDWLGRISNSLHPDYRRAVLGSVARILPLLSEGQTAGLSQLVPAFADGVEPEVARQAVLAVLGGLRAPNLGTRDIHATRLIAGQGSAEQLQRWRNRVIVPLLPQFAALADERLRTTAVSQVLALVHGLPPLDDEGKRGVAEFLRAQPHWCGNPSVFAALQEFYPPEEWIPRVNPSNWRTVGVRDPDRVAAALAASAASPTFSVVAFISQCAGERVSSETLAAMFLRAGPAEARYFAEAVRPEAIRERLLLLCQDRSAPASTVTVLARDLAERAPSESLFPVLKWLLASGDREAIAEGVALSQRLGREEMLPDLQSLLDSMDVALRNSAKQAIDSILELRRLKAEVGQRIAEAGVK